MTDNCRISTVRPLRHLLVNLVNSISKLFVVLRNNRPSALSKENKHVLAKITKIVRFTDHNAQENNINF